MKVLRKNDEFRRMPEKGVADQKAINMLLGMGWNYSPKKAMKDFYKVEEKVKVKPETSSEPSVKAKTIAKERRAEEQKKITKK